MWNVNILRIHCPIIFPNDYHDLNHMIRCYRKYLVCAYYQYIYATLRIMIYIYVNGGSTCPQRFAECYARFCGRTHIEKNHFTVYVQITIDHVNVPTYNLCMNATLYSFFRKKNLPCIKYHDELFHLHEPYCCNVR